MPNVGLESLGFSTAQHYVSLEDLAIARGIEPAKYVKGLGQQQMAVVTPCEDTVTMAAEAGRRALEAADIDPHSIDLLVVGTETGVDHSKPAASYVHELLGLSTHCRVLETKHACYGATGGLQFAIDRVLSGRSRGRKSLIIASDIARYGVGSAGEPTQGAGAVALVVSDNPRLIRIEAGVEGVYSKQVMDFWRPLYRKEALADGHFSIQCYLDALEGAYDDWRQVWMGFGDGPSTLPDIAACLYHVPFGKMAKKAHGKYLQMVGFDDAEAADADYGFRVSPYLELCSRVGNVYTGSLYFALYNLLNDASDALAGAFVSMFSYGSGCMAEYFLASVVDEPLRLPDFRPILDARTQIDVPRYEQLLEVSATADRDGGTWNAADYGIDQSPFVFEGVREHRRIYTTNS